MEITLYRYLIAGAKWDNASLLDKDFIASVAAMNALRFQGYDNDSQYGLAQCGHVNGVIYGLFVQKFPTRLIDYDPETKEETIQDTVDSGEYLFLLFPEKYELYLQVKRSADLPRTEEIIKRFTTVMSLATLNEKINFSAIKSTEDIIDRERILNIFYKEAQKITELELEDFDPAIILQQREVRGSIQKYFNPKEEYQEAMQEAGLKFATHTHKISIKAKRGENFQKDPIARAALEGSKKPVKIVYEQDSQSKTAYGVTKNKEIITIESAEFDLEKQIGGIIAKLRDEQRKPADKSKDQQERLL